MAMRRSVLLAVWLGLVLSLLKESAAQDTLSTATPASRSTGKEQSPQAAPSWSSPTEASPSSSPRGDKENGTSNETAPEPPVIPSQTPSENGTSNETAPEPPVIPSQTPSENGTSNETAPEPPVTTSQTPSDNSTVNETTPEPSVTTSPTPAVDFCNGDPCGRNSATCVSLNSRYTCVCQYGLYYSNENCYGGKVFPAIIAVNANYTDSLEDVNSTEYEDVFNNLSKFFKEALGTLTGYVETVIIEIPRPGKSRNSVPLNVKVTSLFTSDSPENNKTVYSAVQQALEKGNQFYVQSYSEAKHCDVYQCDTKTTVCEGDTLPECKCKSDLEKTQWDDRSCSACSKSCSAAKHKYCVKEEEVPTCKCMANFKTKLGDCVPCPVGYSGEECTDNTELILIIVGTVFGAIILSLVIAVSIVSVRAKHKQSPERRSLIKSDTNTSDDRPSMFPRVQTTSGHANPGYQPHNPYEMSSKNRDRFPERDYDDMYEASREPRGFRTQNRY
ncbi:mucin-13 isoform X3 [Oenanthe melanoleuca]|uniref:mucin-13 isoform X3 n=1 Tax=Oenanthe melanoleuca TaxID=2939378 RepID=UPI0024C20BC6|nr:mucin-13 isoform X3 [Oenanthe melanoleuca]